VDILVIAKDYFTVLSFVVFTRIVDDASVLVSF
jgi:hypothetical protein